jgi:hypothetical protein
MEPSGPPNTSPPSPSARPPAFGKVLPSAFTGGLSFGEFNSPINLILSHHSQLLHPELQRALSVSLEILSVLLLRVFVSRILPRVQPVLLVSPV